MTVAEMLDLEVGQRQATFSFELFDPATGDIEALYPVDTPPVIACNAAGVMKRTLTGFQLVPGQAELVDEARHRIRVAMVLGGESFPLGEFLFADVTRAPRSFGESLLADLADENAALDQALDHDLAVPAFTDLASVARNLIAEVGITRYAIETTGAFAGTALAWTLGTSRLSVLEELAVLGGWFSPYFDNNGIWRLRRNVGPSFDPTDIIYATGRNIVAGSVAVSDNLLDLPNRFIVVDTSVHDLPVVGSYDVPAGLPWSAFNRGFVIPNVFTTQGLGSQTAADQAARIRAQQSTLVKTLTFSSPPDPRHDVFSSISFDDELWLETAWALPCREGSTMTHRLTRVQT